MSTTRGLTLAVAGVWLLLAPVRAQDERDLDVLLDRLAVYLQHYETQLSTVIADEHYVQEERRVMGGARQLRISTELRVTDAEVLFLRLPGEAEWFGIRDVKKVAGKPVARDGVTLTELMRAPGSDILERAAAIVQASSQYNLGGRRTLNMPTVPLEALGVRNHVRYVFEVGARTRVDGVQTRRLEFQEFDEPTLVRATDGGSLWTRGTAWIDPVSGALWRAELVVGPDRPGAPRRPHLESKVRVDFQRHAALDLLVPKELVESFWIRGGIGTGRGRYSNFRKFATSAHVRPQASGLRLQTPRGRCQGVGNELEA